MKNEIIKIEEIEINQKEITALMDCVFKHFDTESFSPLKCLTMIRLLLDIMSEASGLSRIPEIATEIRKYSKQINSPEDWN